VSIIDKSTGVGELANFFTRQKIVKCVDLLITYTTKKSKQYCAPKHKKRVNMFTEQLLSCTLPRTKLKCIWPSVWSYIMFHVSQSRVCVFRSSPAASATVTSTTTSDFNQLPATCLVVTFHRLLNSGPEKNDEYRPIL